MVSVLSGVKTSVSMEVKPSEQSHEDSSPTGYCAHSTHVPTKLLTGKISVSAGGVGGSGSGRSHAANSTNTASTTAQSITLTSFNSLILIKLGDLKTLMSLQN